LENQEQLPLRKTPHEHRVGVAHALHRHESRQDKTICTSTPAPIPSFFTEKIHIEIESNRILQSQGPDTSGVEVHDPKELLVEAGSVEEDQRRTELQALLLDQGVLTRWEAFKAGTVRRIHT